MKPIRIPVPQVTDPGFDNQCLQAISKGILKFILDKDYSFEELDGKTGHLPGKWTFTVQAVRMLHKEGINFMWSSNSNLTILEGEERIRKEYGESAENIIQHMNMPDVMEAAHYVIEHGLHKQNTIAVHDIEEHLRQGHPIILLIDVPTLRGERAPGAPGIYAGHFITLVGFDNEQFYYHDSGPRRPGTNVAISKQHLLDAWNVLGTDNTAIIILGKR
jgi:hypothetical protein